VDGDGREDGSGCGYCDLSGGAHARARGVGALKAGMRRMMGPVLPSGVHSWTLDTREKSSTWFWRRVVVYLS
jgi:hypothetical protein